MTRIAPGGARSAVMNSVGIAVRWYQVEAFGPPVMFLGEGMPTTL